MLKCVSVLGLLGIVALTASACGSSSTRDQFGDPASPVGTGDNGTSGAIGGRPAGENPKADECQKMDIVFIVDDSGSMVEEQSNLAANFPKFVSVLESFKTKSGSKIATGSR